jgi:hypothetical protein
MQKTATPLNEMCMPPRRRVVLARVWRAASSNNSGNRFIKQIFAAQIRAIAETPCK